MISDLMHSWRALRRTPLMVLVVVGSLGAGIGVNTVVFSWIQALVFRPIPGVANAAAFHLIEPETHGLASAGDVVDGVPATSASDCGPFAT